MKNDTGMPRHWATAAIAVAVIVGLAGCGSVSDVDKAKAQVAAKEKALTQAQADFATASGAFCDAATGYIQALDRYGDVLHDTAPTVGDVRDAGADLAQPREDAFDDAEAAVAAQQELADAEQALADAQAKLAEAEGTPAPEPDPAADDTATAPLAPADAVARVQQAEEDYAAAQGSITDDTPLAAASEQFNSAVVALETAWLQLFLGTGCVTDDQAQQAAAAVGAYTAALQQELTTAGFYTGPVDGVYGPATVQAVEALQSANGLPVTGTMDKATADALQAALDEVGGAADQAEVAATAAVQQTLRLLGFWDGPVDGVWTPALTDAIKAFQVELGVEPTGTVDAATIAAFHQAIADLTAPEPTPTPTPSPTETDEG